MNRQVSIPSSYLITDRRVIQRQENRPRRDASAEVDEVAELVGFVERAAAAGVDFIQVRERDLRGGDLLALTARVASATRPHTARVLVNDRADIAALCGVGVHLTTRSMRVDVVRRVFGDDMLIAASTHSLREAREAEAGGADFIVFGPVFETPSKMRYGVPVGLEALADVATRLRIPVLALGGIKLENYQSAFAAGASGIAAITLFTEAADLREVVRKIKAG